MARTVRDAAGRAWAVYDFSIRAGQLQKQPIGNGQYRGFAPLDGGARRTYLLLLADRERGTSDEVVLEQLAASKLYHLDDPKACAEMRRTPERTDPVE